MNSIRKSGKRLAKAKELFGGTTVKSLQWGLPKSVARPHHGRNVDDSWATVRTAIGALQAFWQGHDVAPPPTVCNQHQDLVGQLVRVELPLTRALLTPDSVEPGLIEDAVDRFERIVERLDADGWPHAEIIHDFSPLVASWSRCFELAHHLRLDLDADLVVTLGWVAQQFVRIHDRDCRPMLAAPDVPKTTPSFANQVLAMSVDKDDHQLAIASGLVEGRKTKATNNACDLTDSSSVSEWSESAILRTDWQSKSARVAIRFDQSRCYAEIAGRRKLISGPLEIGLVVDGVEQSFEEGFSVVCEMHDFETTYLELETGSTTGVRVQRQILLSRTDAFLFWNDVVLPGKAASIEWTSQWPLAEKIETILETETRELYLTRGGKIKSLVIPPGLPEWIVDPDRNSLAVVEGNLVLKQSAVIPDERSGINIPMFFDLDARRSRGPRTWRKLTVAESLEIVPETSAAAFRVQVGRFSYVFYRSLTPAANRTFMGENYSGEFFTGRMEKNGEMTPLINVEPSE